MKRKSFPIIKAICIIALIICIVIAVGFAHGRNCWHWDGYILSTDIMGHYGDFVGGFIGSLLSIILLYYTLLQQRRDSSRNTIVYEKQQINDDFYHLMSLYQNIINSQSIKIDSETDYKGKEVLHAYLDIMRENYDTDTKMPRRKSALIHYMDFYAYNSDFAPIYYRTLYRLCESVVDKEADTNFKNIELIKILRAQFTDSELVLMRYNAQTRMGKPFQKYINHFNLLKHLPPLDLLEFKEFRTLLNDEDISSMNIILVQIRQIIEDILDDNSLNHKTMNEFKSLVSISIMTTEKKDSISLTINRLRKAELPEYDPFNCINCLDEDLICKLFSYFLYDCIVIHNFQTYNIRRELSFSNETSEKNGKEQFVFMVQNIKGRAINLTWNQYKTRQITKF